MKWIALASCIGICLCVGFIGSYVTIPSIETWYQTLEKPFFNPPNWIFGPVWTILYVLMGVSLFLVFQTKGKNKSRAIGIFALQLFLNFLWSVLFFYFHSPLLALIELCALWLSIYATIDAFRTINKRAAWLLVPYICWVSFASLLNLSIVILN